MVVFTRVYKKYDKPIINHLVLSEIYTFFDLEACFSGFSGPNNFSGNLAYLCSSCWAIKFEADNTAKIWSYRCDQSVFHASCQTDLSYSFDEFTNTVTINSVTPNTNVPQSCYSQFLGKWTWKKGEFSEGSYSNSSSADFHLHSF